MHRDQGSVLPISYSPHLMGLVGPAGSHILAYLLLYSERPCHLSDVGEDPLAGSTNVRGPASGDSFQ